MILGSVATLARALRGFRWWIWDVIGGRGEALGELLMALLAAFTIHACAQAPSPNIIRETLRPRQRVRCTTVYYVGNIIAARVLACSWANIWPPIVF